jgi:hypothetical protein
MPEKRPSALTAEQWETRDYRQLARALDLWAKEAAPDQADDATEYVAKVGLDSAGSVIVMNRAHDRVRIPPPARLALAAFTLVDQPFGFTHADAARVRRAAEAVSDRELAAALVDLGERLAALLPPADT